MTTPRRRFLTAIIVSATAIGTLTACEADAVDPDAVIDRSITEFSTITYRYSDSTTPPDSHRSYVLTIARDEARIVVDSYGTVLHDVTEPIGLEMRDDMLESVRRLDAREVTCDLDGGWRVSVEASAASGDAADAGADPVTVAVAEPCGQLGRGHRDDLTEAVQPVLDLFDLAVLLAPGPVDA